MPELGDAAFFVPDHPVRVLVLAHGFPWPDGSQSDSSLAEYARATVTRWTEFAESQRAILVAPAFGGSDFGGYRALFGRRVDADEFVKNLVGQAGEKYIPSFSGRFSLHGHSAGAQFAARYLVRHPQQLEEVILSAPGTYPFPDRALSWPFGMAPVVRDQLSGSPAAGKPAGQAAGALFVPRPEDWLTAASAVSVTVLVGTRDTQPQPAEPGQPGSTRIERAHAWINAMHRHAETNHRASMIRLARAEGLDHDEAAMAIPAQQILARTWTDVTAAG